MILRPPTEPPKPSKLRLEVLDAHAFDRHAKAPPAWEVLEKGFVTLKELMAAWKLPPLGEATLLEVLDSDPESHLRSTPKSVVVRVPSAKMRRFIQCASRTVEYAFVHYLEQDTEVLLYVDQPLTVKIWIRDSAHRRREVRYICGYLVIRADGVHVYECKPIEWLREQTQGDHPYPRYVHDPETGTWHHPAAEEAFRAYGFTHHVFHSGEVNVRWLRNVRYIADFLSVPAPPGVDEALAALQSAKSLPFFEARLVPGTTREAWFWLIAAGKVAFDLERDPLDRPDLLDLASIHDSHASLLCHRLALDSRVDSGVVPSLANSAVLELDPGRCVFFRDVPHQVVSRDENELVLSRVDEPGDSKTSPSRPPVVLSIDSVPVFFQSGDLRAVAPKPNELVAQHSRRILASATNAERKRALERWSAVCHYRDTGAIPDGNSRSAVFNYVGWAREASRLYGSEFLGMFRRVDGSSGVPRTSPEQRALLREVAESFHAGKYAKRRDSDGTEHPVPSRRRLPAAYADYLRLSRERGLKPRSERRLRRELEKFSIEASERARRGKRAADKYAAPAGLLRDTLPVHGTRPFEVAHVDHKKLDTWCISGATGAVLGRPWLTLIFDAYSRMPLGYILRFDPPSVYSVMCAIYDCVQRHNRFPDSLVSDQGIEFESPDLLVALGYLRAAHVRRPPSKPRFGSLIERLFGSIEIRLIQELSGSIDTIARSRELTSSHDPQRHALWTLSSLSKLLDRYLFETYPAMRHHGLGTTPQDTWHFGMAHAGERVARHVPLDDTLSLALSETVPGHDGCRTVPKAGGPFTVGYLPFQHPEFSDGCVRGKRIPVRRCSVDASFVYVLMPHKPEWERARLASASIDLTQCSWRQARALLEEKGRHHLIASLPDAKTANALVMSDLLLSMDEYESEALERRIELDAEQGDESLVRAGIDSAPGVPDVSPTSPCAEHSTPPAFDPSQLRPYDEETD